MGMFGSVALATDTLPSSLPGTKYEDNGLSEDVPAMIPTVYVGKGSWLTKLSFLLDSCIKLGPKKYFGNQSLFSLSASSVPLFGGASIITFPRVLILFFSR